MVPFDQAGVGLSEPFASADAFSISGAEVERVLVPFLHHAPLPVPGWTGDAEPSSKA